MNRLEIEREDPEKKKREGQGETIHSHVNVSFSTTSSGMIYSLSLVDMSEDSLRGGEMTFADYSVFFQIMYTLSSVFGCFPTHPTSTPRPSGRYFPVI